MLEPGRGETWSRLQQALTDAQPASWRQGWQIAYDVGPPLAPALWRRQEQERNVRARLVWLAAYALAAGPAASTRLLEAEWLRGARPDERLLGLLEVALSEWVPPTPPAPRDLLAVAGRPSTRVAAALALAKLKTPVPLPPDWFGQGEPDPGLVAAAVLCGGSPPAPLLRRWLESDPGQAPASLVWRAALLTRVPEGSTERTAMALRALSSVGDSNVAVRQAAALALARLRQPVVLPAGTPDPDVLLALVSEPTMRDEALARGWLEPVPSPRWGAGPRATLVVAYVLAASPSALQAAVPDWAGGDLAAPAALAIALRAAAGELTLGGWIRPLASSPTGQWLDLVAGGQPAAAVPGGPPPQVLALAAAHRLPGDVLARLIEEELWHRDFHPGRVPFVVRLGLIADCLLTGSDYARSVRAGERYPYLPADLTPSDSFFEVAYELYDWHASTTDGIPESIRLVR